MPGGLNKTQIANLGLLAVGQGLQIGDFDSDQTAAGKAARQAWTPAVKICHGEADWFFARKQEALSPFGDPDEEYNDSWDLAYHVPSDCEEFRGIVGTSTVKPEWVIWDATESGAPNGLILTNESDAVGRWTYVQANEGRWPIWFAELVAKKLAVLMVPALVPGDYAKRLEVVTREYLMALDKAKARNFNADRPSGVPASEAEVERS
ncbi:MAG TPA: hypothetical protein VEJ18_04320 [Planctomycetota bacterium]|nr:hypothetical protein [Planctomycetota bacterium]